MKIGVISDTHMSKPTAELASLTDGVFADVSMVLHVTQKLPSKEIITVNNYRIGLIHGWGSPKGLEDRIVGDFQDVDAIVYGHTHKAANHIKNGILMFNPGAFSGTFIFGRTRSVGLLSVGDGIRGSIVNL